MQIKLIFKYSSIFIIPIAFNSYSEEFEYLQPNEVSGIPKYYAETLTNEGCTIPKWVYEFGGITKGQFAKSGQVDLAVLCKKEEGNFIRVFWAGEAPCSDTIESFGQYINTVGEKYIIDHYGAYGGNEPPKITHEAINDSFVEKASIVRYCHDGTWLELSGAD